MALTGDCVHAVYAWEGSLRDALSLSPFPSHLIYPRIGKMTPDSQLVVAAKAVFRVPRSWTRVRLIIGAFYRSSTAADIPLVPRRCSAIYVSPSRQDFLIFRIARK